MSFLSYQPCDTFLAMFGQLFLLSYFYLWNGSDCPIPVPPPLHFRSTEVSKTFEFQKP